MKTWGNPKTNQRKTEEQPKENQTEIQRKTEGQPKENERETKGTPN